MSIRNRNTHSSGDEDREREVALNMFKNEDESYMSAGALMGAGDGAETKPAGAKFGYLEKKNTHPFIDYFPCCFKLWKTRFFVLQGEYLYRFKDEAGEKPKGVPIPIQACKIRALTHDVERYNAGSSAYSKEPYCFEVAMIRKRYIMRAANEEEARQWVMALSARKASSIREGLGHEKQSAAVKKANSRAKQLFDDRILQDAKDATEMLKESERLLGRQGSGYAGMNLGQGSGEGEKQDWEKDFSPMHMK